MQEFNGEHLELQNIIFELADKLDNHHHNVNIAQITGTTIEVGVSCLLQ